MPTKIKAGVVGAAGYTGGELIRLLANHPNVEILFMQSRSQAGQPVETVHADLVGDDLGSFTENIVDVADVIFLCMGHGTSAEFLMDNSFGSEVKIIDLSQDFRISSVEHDFIYGLPEINREKIKAANKIANPGCFATAITLGLLPLAQAGLLPEDININGITGATGAGQSLATTSHFSWRDNNISVYKPFEHQHLLEIRQTLTGLQNEFTGDLSFIPVRGNFPRGIMVTTVLKCDLNELEAIKIYADFYSGHPFTILTTENPHLKQVVNTNKALVYVKKHNNKLLIICIIDNLLKGASGQAVQNMNLMFGLDETTGLKLKASAF